jgi:hypothetical protein
MTRWESTTIQTHMGPRQEKALGTQGVPGNESGIGIDP